MGSLQRSMKSRNPAGFYGLEDAAALFIGGQASESMEGGVGRFVLSIGGMIVLASRVGLPQFKHDVAGGGAIAVEDAAGQFDPLATCAGAGETSQRLVHRKGKVKEGADRLPGIGN